MKSYASYKKEYLTKLLLYVIANIFSKNVLFKGPTEAGASFNTKKPVCTSHLS